MSMRRRLLDLLRPGHSSGRPPAPKPRHRRPPVPIDPALFPHAPIFIPSADTVVLWSTKSACSHVVLWAFLQNGHFGKATAYSRWPHDYRERIYRADRAFAEPLQRLLDSRGAGQTLVKVTRDPKKRLVSIFRHACRFPILYAEVHRTLGFDVREKGLSLVDLDRVLRRIRLTPPTDANPHVRVQASPVWEMGFDRVITLNIDEVPLDASLNAIERALGLAVTDFDALPAFAHLRETHYAREGAFTADRPIENYRFRPDETAAFPKRQLTASALLENMARRLYHADYAATGTADTRGELFRPDRVA